MLTELIDQYVAQNKKIIQSKFGAGKLIYQAATMSGVEFGVLIFNGDLVGFAYIDHTEAAINVIWI